MATKGSIGAFPAPPPSPASEASTRALLDGHLAVRDGEGEVLMGVHAHLGRRIEGVAKSAHPFAHLRHGKAAPGVHDVDAVSAVGLHQPGLPGERGGFVEVARHEEAGDVHVELAGEADVLGPDVRLGAVPAP